MKNVKRKGACRDKLVRTLERNTNSLWLDIYWNYCMDVLALILNQIGWCRGGTTWGRDMKKKLQIFNIKFFSCRHKRIFTPIPLLQRKIILVPPLEWWRNVYIQTQSSFTQMWKSNSKIYLLVLCSFSVCFTCPSLPLRVQKIWQKRIEGIKTKHAGKWILRIKKCLNDFV